MMHSFKNDVEAESTKIVWMFFDRFARKYIGFGHDAVLGSERRDLAIGELVEPWENINSIR